jgi:hypothetical protein
MVLSFLQLTGRDIQQMISDAGLNDMHSAASHKRLSASQLSLELAAISEPMVPLLSAVELKAAVAEARQSGGQLILLPHSTHGESGRRQAAEAAPMATCRESDRQGLRVTPVIVEGLGVTLMLVFFTALGLAALFCIATPTRLLDKDVPVGREH